MKGIAAVRPATAADHEAWLRMRVALWPDCPVEEHVCEIANILGRLADQAVFVAVRPSGSLGGFIELSVKSAVEGCERGPVGYVEGWYVDPDIRREGTGRALIRAGEEWARRRGCVLMASDAQQDNASGIAAHRAVGFEEVEHVVLFRKPLELSGPGIVIAGEGI